MELKIIDPLTKEQLEYIELRTSFDNMNKQFRLMSDHIDTCNIKNPTTIESNYKIEDVFYYLLDLYSKK